MNSKHRAVCARCGVVIMSVAVVHICIEGTHFEERRPEAVVLTAAYLFGSHEDRAAEFAVDLDIFARQVVAICHDVG